jgi:hypothetical protein
LRKGNEQSYKRPIIEIKTEMQKKKIAANIRIVDLVAVGDFSGRLSLCAV